MAAGRTPFSRSAALLAAGVAALIASSSNDPLGVAAFSTSSSARTGRRVSVSVSVSSSSSSSSTRSDSHIDNNPLSLQALSQITEQHQTTTSQQQQPKQQHTNSNSNSNHHPSASKLASLGLAVAIATTALPVVEPANAYIPTDYASETVQNTIQDLKAASGNVDDTFKIYESIADIITEGKGVGGQINYQGIQLERGYVADEDTSIYNPGLSLLTESEKERLVEGVIDARKIGLKSNQWSENNEYAYSFLRTKLDPLHTTELRGFLGIVPFYGAALYVGVVAVQQFFREGFQVAYLVGVAAFFVPIIGLILAGP